VFPSWECRYLRSDRARQKMVPQGHAYRPCARPGSGRFPNPVEAAWGCHHPRGGFRPARGDRVAAAVQPGQRSAPRERPDHMRSQERLAARRHAGQTGLFFACALIADVAAAISCTARLRPRTSITSQAGDSNRN